MTVNQPTSIPDGVHLGELCKVEGAKGTDTLSSTPIPKYLADVRGPILNACPWAGIDMGALPEESGK